MNVKPGDLAVIVNGDDGPFSRLSIGWLVHVEEPGSSWEDVGDSRLHWICAKAGGGLLPFDNPNGDSGWDMAVEIPDADLRAIRDPGEDARDETLEWLPVPQKETQWT